MQKSVLVVVNDIEQARLYRKYFTDRGLNVTCFLDPQHALKNFKLDFKSYNMILTDFKPTDINGITFAKEIRKIRGYSIFIILMTGYFMSHSLRQSEIVDTIDKVLVKPFSLEYLDRIINHYVNRCVSDH